MKKVFVYNSQIKEDDHSKNKKIPNCGVGKSMEIETRRRLFRQPQSCPHFSIRIDNLSESSDDSPRRYYLRRKAPETVDIEALLESKVKYFTGNEFLYLTYSVPANSEHFTPYSFKEVPYGSIDRSKYFTISSNGVTIWSKEECHFTPLNDWVQDYKSYCNLMNMKTFSKYRLWKSFKKWSKLIKRQKFEQNRKLLSKGLLLANTRLAISILEFKRVSEQVEKIQLFYVENNSVWILQEFIAHQASMHQILKCKIGDFYDQIVNCIHRAALEAFQMEGYSIETKISNVSFNKYMDRIRKRTFCKLITRYLRYIDYMTMSLLYNMILHASQNFLKIVERSNNQDLGLSQSQPLFAIKIALTSDEISISPSQHEIVESLKEMICQSLDFVKVVKRFDTNVVFKKFTDPIIGGIQEHLADETSLDVQNNLFEDIRLTSIRSRIISLVNDNFENLTGYMEIFQKYRAIYAADLNTNTNSLGQLSDVQELQFYCERYMGQMNDIKVIEPYKNFGIFQLDQRCFDEVMTPLYQRLFGKICTHLPVLLSNLLTEMNESCQEIMGTLLTPPEGTVGFVEYINFIDKCESMLFDIHDKLTTVDQLLGLIITYKIEAGDDLWKRFKSISEFLVNCKDAHAKKLNQKDTFIEKLSKSIDKDVYVVYEEVAVIKQEINKDWILSDESRPELVKETLTNALEQLQLANIKLSQLQLYCEAMELDLIDLAAIFSDVQLEAKIRFNLWECLEEWTDSIQDWYTQNFHQLDIGEMDSINSKILEHCIVFEKDLPPNPISPKLKASVELFKGKIEIISQLRNETLKPRHWAVIEEIIGKKIVEDDSITIRDFEEVGVFIESTATRLIEISSQARAEQQLEEQLLSIEKFWMKYEFTLEKYRYYRNNFVLTNIEEVALHLDDSFVRTKVIQSSEYVEPIRDRIEQWIVHLNICMETVSQWKICQCNWARFESLFTLPGIEFKMPGELALFQQINNIWKDTITEVYENRLAIVALLRPGRLATFKDCNQRIQELSDRMDSYLNTRRLNYPRLYFLSNFEIITVLTVQPKNIQRIEKYLPKLFDSIFGLKIVQEDIKCLLEPMYTITHMASETGFEVPLLDMVQIEGSADQWLKVLEIEMVNTIRKAIKAGYHSYDSENVLEWGQEQLSQVQLVVNRLKLFEEIDRYFEEPDPELELRFASLMHSVKSLISLEKQQYQNPILTSLLYTLIYYQDILQRIKSKSIDITIFKRIWRYKWTNDSPVLTINDDLVPYFNEFIFLGDDFLFTPQTEKVYFHFQRAIQSGLNNFLCGANASGKTSTIRAFAKLVAKFTITFDCNSMNINYSDFQRILFGIVQTGSWSIFRGIDRVSEKILSIIGDQLMLIKDAKLIQSKEIELTGKFMRFNPWNQFFFVSNFYVGELANVPENLKIYLREIVIQLPDLKLCQEIYVNLKADRNSARLLGDELHAFQEAIDQKIIIVLQGPPGSGKSHLWKNYMDTYNASNPDQISYKQIYVNSLPVDELYGYYNDKGKWIDGFFEKTFEQFYKTNPIDGQMLIILDGQIRSQWIGLLLGVNCRRRFITLPNLSLLRIPKRIRIVIETELVEESELQQSSFIGLIKCERGNIASVDCLFQELVQKSSHLSPNLLDLQPLFDKYFIVLSKTVSQVENRNSFQNSTQQSIKNLVSFLEVFHSRSENLTDCLEQVFVFSILWTMGGCLTPEDKQVFERVLKETMPSEIMPRQSLWDSYFCEKDKKFKSFQELTPAVGNISLTMDVTVPSLEATRFSFIMKRFGTALPILLRDSIQDHYTEIIQCIPKIYQDNNWLVSRISLCTSTKSADIQNELESVLFQRRKQSIGPNIKTHRTYIIHDSCSGADQGGHYEDNIEFVRQLTELGGYYERESWNMTKLLDVNFVGVISEMTPVNRSLAEKCLVLRPVTSPYDYFRSYFGVIIEKLSSDLPLEITECQFGILETIISFWKYLDDQLPASFSIFDMKRILIGTFQKNSLVNFSTPGPLIKLFQYETIRVCCDSISSNDDKNIIYAKFKDVCHEKLNEQLQIEETTVFGNFLLKVKDKLPERIYEEMVDFEKLKIVFSDYLVDYNQQFGTNYQIFWHNLMLIQLSRVCGIVRLPQFHCCLIGGIAKKMLFKLAAFINNYEFVELKNGEHFENQIQEAFQMACKSKNHSVCLQISNLTDVSSLKLISNIFDYGYPPVLLKKLKENISSDAMDNIGNRVNIILLYDHKEDMISSMTLFPSIRRHCQLYYLDNWGPNEYESMVLEIFTKIETQPPESRVALSKLAVRMHMDFEKACKPSSFARKFLHLIHLFQLLWYQQKATLTEKLSRLISCRSKLSNIQDMMTSMHEDLKKFLPQLEERKSTLKEMKVKLDQELTTCEDIRTRVMLDEGAAKIQTASTQELTDDVNKDLEIAMPALRAAQDQIKALSKGDWNELKGQNNPAKLVIFVMESVCILFKIKPDWPTAKALINEPGLLKKILEFDKENISEMVSKKIKSYIEHKDFDLAKIEKVSKVSKCLCQWVKAIDQFAKVFKIVEPKVRKQQHAEAARRSAMIELRRKQQELADSESKIQILRDNIEEYETAYKVIQENVDLINIRLTRAHRVTTALAEEQLAWTGDVENMEKQLMELPGYILLISATIAHLGEYGEERRIEFTKNWKDYGRQEGLEINEKFSLNSLLIDELGITQWQTMGLPQDNISIENALILKNSLRYPLLIDTHERFSKWIQKIESNIRILPHKHKDFEEILENAIKSGERVLIPEVGLPINQLLLEVIGGDVVTSKKDQYLKTSSSLIPYKSSFFLYLLTKSSATVFPDEFLNNVNTIDCKISQRGYEEYILRRLSEVELKALKGQSTEVQKRIEEDCQQMKVLQETIINLLNDSTGNILDNESLVAALYETKETYSIVVDRLNDSRESEKVLISIKEKYRPIAEFGAKFLSVINKLRELDAFYFFPMGSFVNTFCGCVEKLEGENADPDINRRRKTSMISNGIKRVFSRVCSRLSREDSFVFACAILDLIANKIEVTLDASKLLEINSKLGITLFEKLNLSDCLRTKSNPIIIIPKENSLENLICELRELKPDIINFISVGTGNEEIVLQMLDAAYDEQHILIMQNAHFNEFVIKKIENQFAEVELGSRAINSSPGTFKLVLIAYCSEEVPPTLLYNSNSCVLNYYSEEFEKFPENIEQAEIISKFNQIKFNIV